MSGNIEKQAVHLQHFVTALFERWKADPAGFACEYPNVGVAQERSQRTETAAMRAIADHVMEGAGFEYEIAETFGCSPSFFVGKYDERKVWRG